MLVSNVMRERAWVSLEPGLSSSFLSLAASDEELDESLGSRLSRGVCYRYVPFCIHGSMAMTDTTTLRMSVELMKNLLREQLELCVCGGGALICFLTQIHTDRQLDRDVDTDRHRHTPL